MIQKKLRALTLGFLISCSQHPNGVCKSENVRVAGPGCSLGSTELVTAECTQGIWLVDQVLSQRHPEVDRANNNDDPRTRPVETRSSRKGWNEEYRQECRRENVDLGSE